ncbi:MAG: biopolymer transporter Tol [Ginsengibacter sp.]
MPLPLISSKKNRNNFGHRIIQRLSILPFTLLLFLSYQTSAQNAQATIEVPEWSLPGSPTHKQVPPPKDFHRPDRTEHTAIGIFEGQSDVGSALVPGASSYDEGNGAYTIRSAGYNIWYTRDEFRYLWKKMSGDVALAADINFPDTAGYFDRKAVLIIRQTLDDDSKEAMVALHGGGLVHLAWRNAPGESIDQQRVDKKGAVRLGIEKRGDAFSIYVSQEGEVLHQFGEPVQLHFESPFYVGIGFTSHLPATADTTILSNVVLENEAGKVK